MLQHQLRVKSVRVVKVQLGTLCGGHVMMGTIVIIVIDHRNLVTEILHQLAGDGGLAAARTACDANDDYLSHFLLYLRNTQTNSLSL